MNRLAPQLPVAALVTLVVACSSGASPASSGPTAASSSTTTGTRTSAGVPASGRAGSSASATSTTASSRPTTRASVAPRVATAVPPVSAKARAAGLVDVRTVVPDAIIDLRYATTDNFTHQQLYPSRARCLVHTSMRPGLRAAAGVLRRQGLVLVFWDCYRPHAVQVRMYRIVPNPAWVAKPGPYARSHEAGRSVDVTLARRTPGGTCAHRVQRHCLLAMGTGFDDFTPKAYAYTTSGLSARAVRHRAVLRHAMAADGLAVYSGEWWHFDGPGSFVQRPILDAPPY